MHHRTPPPPRSRTNTTTASPRSYAPRETVFAPSSARGRARRTSQVAAPTTAPHEGVEHCGSRIGSRSRRTDSETDYALGAARGRAGGRVTTPLGGGAAIGSVLRTRAIGDGPWRLTSYVILVPHRGWQSATWQGGD